MKSALSANLRELRQKRGMKQAEIAGLMGTTDKNWSSYERGITEPNIATLVKIAKIFGISVDTLIGADTHKFRHTDESSKTEVGEPKEKYSFGPRAALGELHTRMNGLESRLSLLEAQERKRRKK
jgi:transcriptional regulator with XRE-family HTH domain